MRIPSVNGVVSFNFAGDAWQDLDWLEIGFYLPDSCYSEEPPEDEDVCRADTEKALIIQDLTFEPIPPVPEPAVGALLLTGMVAVARRRVRPRR